MKKLLTLLLLLVLSLLVSCGSPEQPKGGLITEEPIDCSSLEAKYNALTGDYATMEVNYELLKVYSDTLKKNYEAVLNRFDVRGESYYKNLETEMELNQELKENYDKIWKELNLVNNRGYIMISDNMTLSDNLTESELEMFYKGWDLWWGTLEK